VRKKVKKLTRTQLDSMLRILRGEWRSNFHQTKVPQPTLDALLSRGLISGFQRSTPRSLYSATLVDYVLTDEGLSTLKAEAPDSVAEKDLRAFEDLQREIKRKLDEQQQRKEWLTKVEPTVNQIRAAHGFSGLRAGTDTEKICEIRKLGQWPPKGLAQMLREAHGIAVLISAADGRPAPPFVTDWIEQMQSPFPGKVIEASAALRKFLTEDGSSDQVPGQ
jgi:hypothetical protein